MLRHILIGTALIFAGPAISQEAEPYPALFQPQDVFDLEWATDPQVSPNGKTIVYVRRGFDKISDSRRANLWTIDVASGAHRPLLSGTTNYSSPRWSPDGRRLAYVTGEDQGTQIYVRWLDTGATARITDLTESPGGMSWSPDGRSLAFTMFVASDPEPFVKLPSPPEGAEWVDRPTVIDDMVYRFDGGGYAEEGLTHIFTVSAEGGTARQVTTGDYQYDGAPSWSRDGRTLYASSNRDPNWQRGEGYPQVQAIDVATGSLRAVSPFEGPQFSPQVSSDGRRIAFGGYVDNLKSQQSFRLYIADVGGGSASRLATDLDRTMNGFEWAADGRSIIVSYDDEGETKLGRADLGGEFRELVTGLGGESLGRPYTGASFDVAADSGTIAVTSGTATRPADVAVVRGNDLRRLTRLNDDVASVKRFSDAEEMWTTAADGTRSQSWIVRPPNFDPNRDYPLLLEIHGGPHTAYGPHFSSEVQAYAAAGYIVLYSNPRGSTSYGSDFANTIDKAYPGSDYDDLMAAVDGAIARGNVDPNRLFVTGGSGGGVLTSWIVGKTDRFRAAVVAKPVINWTSFVLTADAVPYFAKYWFGAMPWEDQANYWARSPLSLVGNVKTPTMLLTGEDDYRTPISETEQYYAALQLAGVKTAMVRIQGASHSIAARPSNLMNKIAYVLGWFAKHDVQPQTEIAASRSSPER
ncbi:MAG: S9 family peptidase [Pacificimonas sp.]